MENMLLHANRQLETGMLLIRQCDFLNSASLFSSANALAHTACNMICRPALGLCLSGVTVELKLNYTLPRYSSFVLCVNCN